METLVAYSGLSVRRSGTLRDGNVLVWYPLGSICFSDFLWKQCTKVHVYPLCLVLQCFADWQAGRALDTLPLQSPPQ